MTSGGRISRPYVGLVQERQCSSVNRVTRKGLASPQTSFGVRVSRIECVPNEPQRTSAGRLERDSIFQNGV